MHDEQAASTALAPPAGGPAATGSDGSPASPETSRSRRRRVAVCLAFVALLVAADLASKAAVFEWLESDAPLERDAHGHDRVVIAEPWLAFMLNLNDGAAFGRFRNIPHVLVPGRGLAALLLLFLVVRAPRAQRLYLISLVLILSGALGNLYDNVMRPPRDGRPYGPVRDFIDVYFPSWDWHFPTFNVADSCISVGAVLLLLSGFGSKGAEESRVTEEVLETAGPGAPGAGGDGPTS